MYRFLTAYIDFKLFWVCKNTYVISCNDISDAPSQVGPGELIGLAWPGSQQAWLGLAWRAQELELFLLCVMVGLCIDCSKLWLMGLSWQWSITSKQFELQHPNESEWLHLASHSTSPQCITILIQLYYNILLYHIIIKKQKQFFYLRNTSFCFLDHAIKSDAVSSELAWNSPRFARKFNTQETIICVALETLVHNKILLCAPRES